MAKNTRPGKYTSLKTHAYILAYKVAEGIRTPDAQNHNLGEQESNRLWRAMERILAGGFPDKPREYQQQ